MTTFFRAEWALVQGDPESGERLANEAFTLGDQTGQPDAFAIWANQIAEARYQQGRDHEIVDVVEEVVRTNPGVAAFRTALAACYCDLGRHDEARRTIEPDLVARFSTIGQDIAWLAAVISAADAVYGIGDERGAEALLETLLPYADQYEFVGVSSARRGRHTSRPPPERLGARRGRRPGVHRCRRTLPRAWSATRARPAPVGPWTPAAPSERAPKIGPGASNSYGARAKPRPSSATATC